MKNITLRLAICSAIFLLLLSCSSSKHWNGSDVPGSNTASFTDFNGKSDFKLVINKEGSSFIKYDVHVIKGSVDFVIKSRSRVLLNTKITSYASDLIRVENAAGENYKMILKGDNATGDFSIKYSEPTNTLK